MANSPGVVDCRPQAGFDGQTGEEILIRVKSSALSASIPVDLRPQNMHLKILCGSPTCLQSVGSSHDHVIVSRS
jgi:hypothetical protein